MIPTTTFYELYGNKVLNPEHDQWLMIIPTLCLLCTLHYLFIVLLNEPTKDEIKSII